MGEELFPYTVLLSFPGVPSNAPTRKFLVETEQEKKSGCVVSNTVNAIFFCVCVINCYFTCVH